MKDIFRRPYGVTVKAAASGEARAFDVIASTDDVDLVGDVLTQDWDLRRYNQNPVVLYMHNCAADGAEETLPVGFSREVGVVDGKLRATIVFVTEEASPLAERCYQGFAQGSMRAVSVGFRSKLGRMESRNGQDVFVLSGNELLEISVCPIPINPNAVSDEKSLERDALKAFVTATTPDAPRDATPPAQQEKPTMKTVCKSLGLKEDATEAEVLSAVTALSSSSQATIKSVLDATGAKNVDEAIGVIKAGVQAVEQLATASRDLEASREQVEERDRNDLVAKGVADKKLSPALRDWALEREPEVNGKKGSFKVSLATLKGFLDKAAPIPTLAAGNARPDAPAAAQTAAGADVGTKGWEELTPAQKHDLSVASPEHYQAIKADWERRGKPAMKYARASA